MKGNNQAYKLWLCLLCSFLLLPLEIQAQEKGDSITGKVHKIDEVTVTARRPPAKVTTGSPVQLINKEDIKNLGLQNMADAVRRFAGTNVRDYGGIGGLKTVSIRNLGAAHTAVSYDGVVVSNSQAGQIDIGRFSLDNVSSLSLAIGKLKRAVANLYIRQALLLEFWTRVDVCWHLHQIHQFVLRRSHLENAILKADIKSSISIIR